MQTNNQNQGNTSQSDRSEQSAENNQEYSSTKVGAQDQTEADPNRKATQMPNTSRQPQDSSVTPTAATGKSPVGGSDSLEDYDDSIMPDGEDARVDYDNTQTSNSKAPNIPNKDQGSQERTSGQ